MTRKARTRNRRKKTQSAATLDALSILVQGHRKTAAEQFTSAASEALTELESAIGSIPAKVLLNWNAAMSAVSAAALRGE